MSLGAVKEQVGQEENFHRWMEHPGSFILHHDDGCCERARLWFLAYANSMEIGNLSQFGLRAPHWLSKHFEWGPSEWPIMWCQVVRKKIIDCGVFAALAREVFTAQGQQAHPAQLLLAYNEDCTGHWSEGWKIEEAGKPSPERQRELFPWIGKRTVYHEICLIEPREGSSDQGVARIYDSTWGLWLDPSQKSGFGALIAVRSECPRLLRWGDQMIGCGEWTLL